MLNFPYLYEITIKFFFFSNENKIPSASDAIKFLRNIISVQWNVIRLHKLTVLRSD